MLDIVLTSYGVAGIGLQYASEVLPVSWTPNEND